MVETKSLREEIIDKIAALVTIAFGLVAALAWNSAIQATFARYFGTDGAIPSLYIYAVVVTAVAVLAAIWIARSASRAHAMSSSARPRARPPTV